MRKSQDTIMVFSKTTFAYLVCLLPVPTWTRTSMNDRRQGHHVGLYLRKNGHDTTCRAPAGISVQHTTQLRIQKYMVANAAMCRAIPIIRLVQATGQTNSLPAKVARTYPHVPWIFRDMDKNRITSKISHAASTDCEIWSPSSRW